ADARGVGVAEGDQVQVDPPALRRELARDAAQLVDFGAGEPALDHEPRRARPVRLTGDPQHVALLSGGRLSKRDANARALASASEIGDFARESAMSWPTTPRGSHEASWPPRTVVG